jgi:methylmalonyl-CoA mutase N-terminal domain/subunit
MPPLITAARAHTTEGEIITTLQTIWGDYHEAPTF